MGIDEAGRGPLAGDVVAAAVYAPISLLEHLAAHEWASVNDSKKLSPQKRESLARIIKSTPGAAWAVASASPGEIDSLNILRATHLAMHRAALAVNEQIHLFSSSSGTILVDGNPVRTLPFPSRNIVKGDSKSLLIAAASILAKTARDAQCAALAAQYPQYGFAVHKGYPTPAHLAALAEFGACPAHRRSFAPVRNAIEGTLL